MLEILLSLGFLTAMEIVLGIDNIVFIAILTGRLPKEQQPLARRLGLAAAMLMRLALLGSLYFFLNLEGGFLLSDLSFLQMESVNAWLLEHEEINHVTIPNIILLVGGMFLIGKSVVEIHEKVEGGGKGGKTVKQVSFGGVLVQIALLDIVFSLDSVITAVGMAKEIWVMVAAIIIAVMVMLIFAEIVSAFVEANPTVKMLALSFLILIGVMLVAEGVGTGMDKAYIYFAMTFALVVEMLNLWARRRSVEPAKS